MAYPRRETEHAHLGGNPLPPSEATPQPYSPEHERASSPLPPHCVPAVSILRCRHIYLKHDDIIFEVAPCAHCFSYDPQWTWSTPTLHSSVQDQRYGMPVPYVNGMARGYDVWDEAQQGAQFTPAEETATASIVPLPPLSSDPRRSKSFFVEFRASDAIHEPEPESRHSQRRGWSDGLLLSGQ
jgi:hypothetical protein